jgi:hypothetical protein
MPCKIDHSLDDNLPSFLCRHCHPEINRTPEQVALLDAADRAALAAKQVIANREREIHRTEGKLVGLTKNGEPSTDSVSGKITASLRKKLARLQAEAAR